ncbi:MAG: hypothetical protein WC188_03580 [Candidatus Caldatribacteriota bacterium]
MSLLPMKINDWGEEAWNSMKNSADNLSDKVSTSVGEITDAFQNSRKVVNNQTESGQKITKRSTFKNFDNSFKDLFSIGRPCLFNPIIDKYKRFGNYLRSKMSIIDLVPVDYRVDFQRMAKIVTAKSTDSNSTKEIKEFGNPFSIAYDQKIKTYQKICEYHGLNSKYIGLRLFTTDDTTANDTIQVNYKDSIFKKYADSLSSKGQTFRDVSNSVLGSTSKEFMDNVQSALISGSNDMSSELNLDQGIKDLIGNVVSASSDILLKGNKMTFPKIWQDTTYTGNMSVNVRLISPYGHPKAIKEFILKPLSYIILLSAPQTVNGITYGGNIPITIKAYGLNYTIIGSIQSITFRRGGSETSFNLYKQPLTLDLSIEFQTLFDAFAVYDPGIENVLKLTTDKNIFNNSLLTDPGSTNIYNTDNKNNIMISLGTILSSFKPVSIIDMTVDPQVYGMFALPNRNDIPDSPEFLPAGGNLGTTITSAVSSLENVSKIITNAPQIISQGLSNAVYNIAKESVSVISGTAGDWINKPVAVANTIRNTIIGNLF